MKSRIAQIESKKPWLRGAGFTVIELLVTLSIFGLMCLIAAPNMVNIRSNLELSGSARGLALELAKVRAEAARLRSGITVTFSSTGLTWTISGDGTPSGSLGFDSAVQWSGGTPAAVTFDGLGLIPALTGSRIISLTDSHTTIGVTLNQNGHIDL